LAIWSGMGPVIIRIEESSRPVFMNVRVGSTLPLLRSAIGLVFAAYRAEEEVRGLIAKERRTIGRKRGGGTIEERLSRTRQLGLGVVDGDLVPGVTALAAPVFDHRARIVASIALLGNPEHLEARTSSPAARLLKKTAATISERLGYRAAM
jgi:DNA-binding IclR family transcriptional regulator